jgi:hypothetical protein
MVGEALHGLHEPVFSFAQSLVVHSTTHDLLTLDPFYNTYL